MRGFESIIGPTRCVNDAMEEASAKSSRVCPRQSESIRGERGCVESCLCVLNSRRRG